VRVGLIGCGALGSGILRAVRQGLAGPQVEVVACLVRSRVDAARALAGPGCRVTSDPDAFFREALDLVVEAAGQQAVRQYGQRALARCDLLLTSSGALADDTLRQALEQTAARFGRRIWVPSGAVAGLDGLGAACVGPVEQVLHITRKPPAAWRGTVAEHQVDLQGLREPALLYEGDARESARLFPANVNVQTSVALAGPGFERLRVQVIADPTITRNTHDIVAVGQFGRLQIRVENVPTENPKTGLLTVFSVVHALRRLQSPLFVGL